MKDKIKLTIARIFNIDFIYGLGEACIIIGIFTFVMLTLNHTLNICEGVAAFVIGVVIYIIGIVCELYGKSHRH